MSQTQDILVTTIPAFRYEDANRAIEWLKAALGFTEKAVYRSPEGVVEHAELVLGKGMIMLGTAGHIAKTAHWFTQPNTAGAVTGSVYLAVPDCDQPYASAVAIGAELLQDMETQSYGGRSFIVRDPEGFIWSVGEYNPWSQPSSPK